MPQRKGLLAPQNTFLDTIATRFDGTHSNFVLGNAQVKEFPIVYCSDGFVELTGFSRSQIMSRSCNCSFLWGAKTLENAKERIWAALTEHTELKIEVIFHKKNGFSFTCLLDIVPIKNEKGHVVLFLVSHKDLSQQKRSEGATSSLLTCGLASTVTAAALVAKRRPSLIVPQMPRNVAGSVPNSLFGHSFQSISVVKPRTRLNTQPGERRASAPHTSSNKPDHTKDDSTDDNGKLLTTRVRFSSFADPPRRPESFQKGDILTCESAQSESATSTPCDADNETTTENNCMQYNLKSPEWPDAQIQQAKNTFSETECSSDSSDNNLSTTNKYQRRRSRAVLYHLSGRFDKKHKPKHPFKRLPHISTKNSMPEYKVQDIKASKCILLHYSIFKIVWDWLIVLCTFYFAIVVPYNAAFQRDSHGRSLRNMDMVLEVLFILDILLNFRTTFVSKSGQVVHQSKAIAVNYIRGWFILDLIAAVPFDVVWTIQSPESPVANWMHLMKLARLLRLARLFQKIERYSQYSAVVLGLLMCMFFLLAHWFACGWYGLGRTELLNQATRNHSWLYELSERTHSYFNLNMTDGPSRSSVYVSSLYFTMSSLTSVGFGNVSPNTTNEKIFSIISMLVGALMHAAVFGNVTTIIQRMYARRSAYQMKNQDLKDFTRAHHLPKQLRQRMLEFYQAMWSINRGIDKNAIMQMFPEEMRGDIALHINREMLSLPIFKLASIGCQMSISQLIGTRFSTPGEYLVHKGDAIRCLYFVCSGSLEILDEEGSVVALLGKCDLFGTDIDDRPFIGLSAYDVKALTYCELQYIVLDQSLFDVLDLYPSYQTEFSSSLHDELSFNIKEGFDPFAREEMQTLDALTKPQSSDSNVTSSSPVLSSRVESTHLALEIGRAANHCTVASRPSLKVYQHQDSLEKLVGQQSDGNSISSLEPSSSPNAVRNNWYLPGEKLNETMLVAEDEKDLKSSENGLKRQPYANATFTKVDRPMDAYFQNHHYDTSLKENTGTSVETQFRANVAGEAPSGDVACFKEFLMQISIDIHSIRQEMKLLSAEVLELRQGMTIFQSAYKQTLQRPLKTGIMKTSTATFFSEDQLNPSFEDSTKSPGASPITSGCNISPQDWESEYTSVNNRTTSSSSHESRCVKFNLPDKPHRHHEKTTKVSFDSCESSLPHEIIASHKRFSIEMPDCASSASPDLFSSPQSLLTNKNFQKK